MANYYLLTIFGHTGENCRAHRRKCNVTEGNQCDRCLKMNLPCVFKFTAKPTVLKKVVPFSKKNRMLEQVRLMEQEMAAMETQLREMHLKVQLQPANDSIYSSDSSSSSSTTCSTGSVWSECDDNDGARSWSDLGPKRVKYDRDQSVNADWQLIVRQEGSKNISFQTSIKNVADVAVFLAESLHYFNTSGFPSRTPNYHTDRTHQKLPVTNKMFQVEYIIYSFFAKKKAHRHKLLTAEDSPNHLDYGSRTRIKRQLLHVYFNCTGLVNPLLPKPYFYPLLASQPNSMLVAALASFITFSQCHHVSQIPLPCSRESMAESLRQEAKSQLQDALFDEEPSIFTACSLMYLSQAAMIALDNAEARLYINLAWRMILQLKDQYVNTLSHITSDTFVTAEIAIAESWRRLFYFIRYLEVSLYLLYDGLADVASILFDIGIGYPTVLASERLDPEVRDAVLAFHHVIRIHNCQMSVRVDELKYQLFSGNLDNVPIADVEMLENQLIQFWKSLPGEFRLSDAPLDYLQTDRIQQCQNPYAINLNLCYYAYWMSLETRLMQAPAATDLRGATMDRFDGDRALLIVSVCCDAASKIFQVLLCRLPCIIDLHWLLISCDAATMLKQSANPHIKQRARQNLRITLKVLKQRMSNQQDDDEYRMLKNMLPSVDTSMSTSTSSTSLISSEDSVTEEPFTMGNTMNRSSSSSNNDNSPSAYFEEMKKALNGYFFSGDNTTAFD